MTTRTEAEQKITDEYTAYLDAELNADPSADEHYRLMNEALDELLHLPQS